jgi:hypothetical protein
MPGVSEAHEAEFAACGSDQACIDLHMTRIAAAEFSHKTSDVLELLKPTGWSATFERLQYETAEKIGTGSDMTKVWGEAGADFRKEFEKASCAGLSPATCQKAFDEEVMRIAAVEAHGKTMGEGVASFFAALGIVIDMTPIGDAVAIVDCASSPSMSTCVAAVSGLLPVLGDGAKILLKRGDTVLEVALDANGAIAPAKRNSGITVLGHYPEYVELSDAMLARRYQIPDDVWKKMSDAERWAANQRFLDRTMARGDAIVLATPVANARPGSYYAREIQYMIDKGFSVSADGKTLLPPGKK